MGLSTAGLNLQVAGLTGAASHVSLHTSSPGSDGSNEVTGGSYALARRRVGPQPPAAASRPMPTLFLMFHQARRSRILATGQRRRAARSTASAHSTHRRRSRPQGLTQSRQGT